MSDFSGCLGSLAITRRAQIQVATDSINNNNNEGKDFLIYNHTYCMRESFGSRNQIQTILVKQINKTGKIYEMYMNVQ